MLLKIENALLQIKHATCCCSSQSKELFSHKINYAQQKEKLVFPTKLIFLERQEIPKSSCKETTNLTQIVRQQIALIYDPISYYQLRFAEILVGVKILFTKYRIYRPRPSETHKELHHGFELRKEKMFNEE